jgi:hypothetical protein
MRIIATAVVLPSALMILGCLSPDRNGIDAFSPSAVLDVTRMRKDHVWGEGVIRTADALRFSVGAHSLPTGEALSGHLSWGRVEARVSCFAISGNRAVVGAGRPDQPGSAMYLIVEDAGMLDEANPDRALLLTDAPGQCASLLRRKLTLMPVAGHIRVIQAYVTYP